MAVVQFERAARGTTQKNASSTRLGWLRRIGATISLPIVIGFMMLKPEWFEPDE